MMLFEVTEAATTGDTSVVITLAVAIVSLIGCFVWAVKFLLMKFFGRDGESGAWGKFLEKFDRLDQSLQENTRAVTRLEASQEKVVERLEGMRESQ